MRLDEIKARAAAATEGPWRVQLDGFDYGPWDEVYVANARGQYPCTPCGVPNAEFIAHARTDVPALVAAVEAVLELHALGIGDLFTAEGIEARLEHCVECTQVEHKFVVRYPCPTVAAIRTALGEVEK